MFTLNVRCASITQDCIRIVSVKTNQQQKNRGGEMAATQINKVTFERSLIPYEDLWAKAVRGPFNWRIYLFHIYRRIWVVGKIDGTGKFNWWADIILYIMLHNRETRWWRLKDVYIFLPDSDKMSATKIENDQLVWMTTHTHIQTLRSSAHLSK